jgi:hypothetical protein
MNERDAKPRGTSYPLDRRGCQIVTYLKTNIVASITLTGHGSLHILVYP